MSDTTFSINDELDLDDVGLQPTDAIFTITDVSVEENDRGTRWVAVFEPEFEIEGLMGNTVKDSGYLSHVDRPELVNYGKSGLKRLMRAATGSPSGTLADLRGAQVKARVSEDNSGFPRIGRYSPAPTDD